MAGGRVVAALALAAVVAAGIDGPDAGGAQSATVPDPTSTGHITPRTHTVLRAVQARGLDGTGVRCHAPRPNNPTSDHPKGRACDVFFDPHSPTSVAEGWRLARWLTTHHGRYRVTYLIWQGKYWSADDRRWVPYTSPVYGCPNPANLTGCH